MGNFRIQKKTYIALASVIVLYAVFIRSWHLSGDALFDWILGIGATPADEAWQHGARIWAVFGHFLPGDYFSTYAVTPISNAITYVIFKLFGVSYLTLRIGPWLMGLVCLALLFYAMEVYNDRLILLGTLLFASINLGLIAYSRVAMIEGFLFAFQAAIYCILLRSLVQNRDSFWTGLLFVLCLGVKLSAILFVLPAAALYLLFWTINNVSKGAGPLLPKKWVMGVGMGCFLGLFFVILSGHEAFLLVKAYVANRTILRTTDLVGRWLALPTSDSEPLFSTMPYFTLLSMLSLWVIVLSWPGESLFPPFPGRSWKVALKHYVKQIRSDLEKYPTLSFDFFIFWAFVGGLVVHLGLNADIVGRRMTHLLIPMIMLSARGCGLLMENSHRLFKNYRIFNNPFSWVIMAGISWFGLKAFVFGFLRCADLPFHVFPSGWLVFQTMEQRYHFSRSGLFEFFFTLAALPCILYFYRRLHQESIEITLTTKLRFRSLFIALCMLSVVNQVLLAVPLVVNVGDSYKQISRDLDKFIDKPGDVILGNVASCVGWEGSYYGLFYYPGIGIGYCWSTRQHIDDYIDRFKIKTFIIYDYAGQSEGATLYDWSKHRFPGGLHQSDIAIYNPKLFQFNHIVYSWHSLDDRASGRKARWVVLRKS